MVFLWCCCCCCCTCCCNCCWISFRAAIFCWSSSTVFSEHFSVWLRLVKACSFVSRMRDRALHCCWALSKLCRYWTTSFSSKTTRCWMTLLASMVLCWAATSASSVAHLTRRVSISRTSSLPAASSLCNFFASLSAVLFRSHRSVSKLSTNFWRADSWFSRTWQRCWWTVSASFSYGIQTLKFLNGSIKKLH